MPVWGKKEPIDAPGLLDRQTIRHVMLLPLPRLPPLFSITFMAIERLQQLRIRRVCHPHLVEIMMEMVKIMMQKHYLRRSGQHSGYGAEALLAYLDGAVSGSTVQHAGARVGGQLGVVTTAVRG